MIISFSVGHSILRGVGSGDGEGQNESKGMFISKTVSEYKVNTNTFRRRLCQELNRENGKNLMAEKT